ncbi:sodium:solute symporter family protein [Fictibacillus phosphorivorans]|uniref:sodium:solute symporter family protein n=1 Tax=Fictibacillus phosphorivorans TaxID=1221500 RepID=UPI00203EC994|nr:sodium:solute symporter family protein [Fictibacillus phosphorivorans]MCM3720297.1 sodium:solute symporter family protein [Fictibacillus phosphorivorans]MCM3777987.1 sodium:solute symporter family protein [Fictibacillus phosphorivorans]
MLANVPGYVIWIVASLFIGYFFLMTWIGKKGSSHSHTLKGFTTAKGSVSPIIVGASFAATYASVNLFIGVPGLAYQYGTSVLWYTLGCFGVSWIALVLLAKKFWSYSKKCGHVLTLPEWLGRRYNSKTLQVLVALLILFNVYYIVGQNVGLATIFETIIGMPYAWGIVIAVCITILYIGLGGAYAQLVTDGVQGLFMAVTSILVFVSIFWVIGDFGTLTSKLASVDPNLVKAVNTAEGSPYNSKLAIAAVQFLLFGFVLMPHLLNKILSLDSEKDLRPFVLSSGLILFIISTLMVLGGLAARASFPNLQNADQAIPMYLFEAFHPVFAALLIFGIISAILSSTDSLYLGITSSIGNDIYKVVAPYFNKHLTNHELEQRTLKVSKYSLFFVGLITLYVSLNRPESLSLLIQFSYSAIISGVMAPILLAYFWKHAHKYGAIASLITGTALYCFFTNTGVIENIYLAMLASTIASFAVMILLSFAALSYANSTARQSVES